MRSLKQILQDTKTRYYQLFANNKVRFQLERPLISITFDDVPRSAFENGLPILERHDVKATFYVAMGLSDAKGPGRTDQHPDQETFLHHADILDLDSRGHDIACHTYSHYVLEAGTAAGLDSDAQRNVSELQTLLGGPPVEHFSYPFGQVSFAAKTLLSKHYKSMRSSRPGINVSPTDLHLLRATSVYAPNFDKDAIKRAIELAEHHKGWLIFYTHGVQSNPGPYDCTPDQLDWVVQQSIHSTAEILPVSKAYAMIMSHS